MNKLVLVSIVEDVPDVTFDLKGIEYIKTYPAKNILNGLKFFQERKAKSLRYLDLNRTSPDHTLYGVNYNEVEYFFNTNDFVLVFKY